MALSLYVDGDRWRTHLKDVLARNPGLVPVAKGNGYGFGNGRLARKTQWLADHGLGGDTLAVGTYAEIYNLRGITDTLTSDDAHVGLIQFKVGTGGEAVEYAGEWDLPLNRPIYKAFQLYLRKRG